MIQESKVPLERPICGKGSNIDCTVPGLQPGGDFTGFYHKTWGIMGIFIGKNVFFDG